MTEFVKEIGSAHNPNSSPMNWLAQRDSPMIETHGCVYSRSDSWTGQEVEMSPWKV